MFMSQPRSVGKEGGGKNNVIDISYILSEEVIRNDHRIKDTYVQSRDCCVACASVNYYYISVKLLYKRKKKEKEKNGVHDSKDRNNEIIGRITICHNSQNLKRDK